MSAVAEQFQNQPESDAPPAPLIFTDSAAAKVKELVDEEGNPELKLRVFVQGGGCSGFQYGFTFDEIDQRRRHADDEERRHAADRRDEPAVPGRCRDRLQGRPARRAVRDQEPERHHHLRLRIELLGLILRSRTHEGRAAARPFAFRPCRMSAGYSAPKQPRTRAHPSPRAGCRHGAARTSRASHANATASTCSAGRPCSSVIWT